MVGDGCAGPPSMRIECLGLRLRTPSLAKKAAVKLGDFTALTLPTEGASPSKGAAGGSEPSDRRGPPTKACWLMPSGILADLMGHERTGEAHDQNARSYDAD